DRLQQAQREVTFRPVAMVSELFNLARMVVTFGTMVGLLLSLSWIIALVALLAPIPSFIASTRYGWQGFQLMRRQSPMRRMMQYLTTVQTTDTFHKEVQIYGLGGYFLGEFRRLARDYFRAIRALVIRRYVAAFAWGAVTVLSTAGTFLYVALEVVFGRLTIGDLTLFTRAASSVQEDFHGILGSFSALYEHGLYLSTLFDLLAMTPAIVRPADPAPVRRPFREGIEFRNVTFVYPGRATPALRNVSFRVGVGETVAVVGPNGAGKTTLIKLLARLYDPTEGQIVVDGRDIRDYDPDALRREISALFQDFASFQLTARENIGLGDVEQIENRPMIARAAARAGADRVVERLPDGLDSMLGKWFAGGQQLSGGEWQKLALARAFMRDAQIVVLDEPTAALDA
ncbi:MAG: ABC transporter ATP-binding protein/permease, partial [Dehalococcoidia bacterium]|nr:ABC transporter ATP-binding protein/permease [Dehalococcoidia bacterium]